IALAQHAQIEQLIAALARKCTELEALKGSKDELQQTLALIDELTKQQQALAARHKDHDVGANKSKGEEPPDRSAKKRGTAATPQPALTRRPLICELPASELVCDS